MELGLLGDPQQMITCGSCSILVEEITVALAYDQMLTLETLAT